LGLLILAVIIGVGVLFSVTNDHSPGVILETPAATEWIAVFFTNPEAPDVDSYRGGPDEALSVAIDAARYSVDIAAFDLDLWSLRDALIRAHQRGVTVRVVVDSDHFEVDEVQDLIAAGIDVVQDQRPSLMHHKFVVIDRSQVWTGSMNFTVNGAYRNDNNLVQIQSVNIARDYAREFEEMFIHDRFGALSLADTPYPTVLIEGVTIEVMFSPDDGVIDPLVEHVSQAQDEIVIMAFSLTSDLLAEALLERAGKVIIIDGSIVITGSYNFSRNAEGFNDENVLVIHDQGLAARFLLEWERVFALAVH
jgi:phosphatidylserine/phosphatidylglycerophosphate/cardiolipin synthase-like enzyme